MGIATAPRAAVAAEKLVEVAPVTDKRLVVVAGRHAAAAPGAADKPAAAVLEVVGREIVVAVGLEAADTAVAVERPAADTVPAAAGPAVPDKELALSRSGFGHTDQSERSDRGFAGRSRTELADLADIDLVALRFAVTLQQCAAAQLVAG